MYHYHRSTIKGFFKQQYRYGMFVFPLYFRGGNAKMVRGDSITKPSISLQVFLSYIGVLFLILGLAFSPLYYLSFAFLLALLATYLYDASRLSRGAGESPALRGDIFAKERRMVHRHTPRNSQGSTLACLSSLPRF